MKNKNVALERSDEVINHFTYPQGSWCGVFQFFKEKENVNIFISELLFLAPVVVRYKMPAKPSGGDFIREIVTQLNLNDSNEMRNILQDEHLLSTVSLMEIANLLNDCVFPSNIILLSLENEDGFVISAEMILFLNDLLRLPLRTRLRWCVVTSLRETPVLLGLSTPESYCMGSMANELHVEIRNQSPETSSYHGPNMVVRVLDGNSHVLKEVGESVQIIQIGNDKETVLKTAYFQIPWWEQPAWTDIQLDFSDDIVSFLLFRQSGFRRILVNTTRDFSVVKNDKAGRGTVRADLQYGKYVPFFQQILGSDDVEIMYNGETICIIEFISNTSRLPSDLQVVFGESILPPLPNGFQVVLDKDPISLPSLPSCIQVVPDNAPPSLSDGFQVVL